MGLIAQDLKPDATRTAGSGLSLFFSHFGDAHVDCPANVTARVDITCDKTLPGHLDPQASGRQGEGCDWYFEVKTADAAVCTPTVANSSKTDEVERERSRERIAPAVV